MPLAKDLNLEIIDTGEKDIGADGEVPILTTNIDILELAGLTFNNMKMLVLDPYNMEKKFKYKFYR